VGSIRRKGWLRRRDPVPRCQVGPKGKARSTERMARLNITSFRSETEWKLRQPYVGVDPIETAGRNGRRPVAEIRLRYTG